MPVDTAVLAHDMRFFAIAYAIAIGAAFLPLDPAWPKWVIAVVLIGIYAWYVKGHFEDDPDVDLDDLAPLRFNRLDPATPNTADAVPRLRIVNLQVLTALGLIVVGAYFFVDAVEHISASVGVAPIIVALVIATPAARVAAALLGYARRGERAMAVVAVLILLVIAASVVVARVTEG
jgi:cation:H+ antiporter